MRRPELAKLRQPVVHFLEGFRPDPVEATLGVHRGLDEPGVAEHAEMLRDGRLRHPQLTLDLSDGLMGRSQKAQDRAAVRLGNDLEDGFHVRKYAL